MKSTAVGCAQPRSISLGRKKKRMEKAVSRVLGAVLSAHSQCISAGAERSVATTPAGARLSSRSTRDAVPSVLVPSVLSLPSAQVSREPVSSAFPLRIRPALWRRFWFWHWFCWQRFQAGCRRCGHGHGRGRERVPGRGHWGRASALRFRFHFLAHVRGPGSPIRSPGSSARSPGTSARGPDFSARSPGTSARGPDFSARIPGTSARSRPAWPAGPRASGKRRSPDGPEGGR